MDRIRIGNNIAISWAVFDADGNAHTIGEIAELYMTVGGYKIPVSDYSVSGNVISWDFLGDNQNKTGIYKLVVIENDAVAGRHSFDVRDAFNLVAQSVIIPGSVIVDHATSVSVRSQLTYVDIAGIQSINVIESEVDGGTNLVIVQLSNGGTFTIPIKNGSKGDKGDKGDTGATGPKGDKGDVGERGPVGVDAVNAAIGTNDPSKAPSVDKTFADGVLGFTFNNIKGDKGDQGNTGSSVDYPFELVNNVTTDDATKGLSAAQGVVLDSKISQLQQEVDDNRVLVSQNPETGKEELKIGDDVEWILDNEPEAGSDNLVKSCGVNSDIAKTSCGKALESKTVSAIYTHIDEYNGDVILKVTNNANISSAILAIATAGSESAVTQIILNGETLNAGTHYYLLSLSSAENYIRCMNGSSAATGVVLEICEFSNKSFADFSQNLIKQTVRENQTNSVPSEDAVYKALTDDTKNYVTKEISANPDNKENLKSLTKAVLLSKLLGEACCGKTLETKTVSTIYTTISSYTGLVILKVTNDSDISSAILAIATAGSESAVTQIILNGETLNAGTHYYLLSLSSAENYIRCMNGSSAATGVVLEICELLRKSLSDYLTDLVKQQIQNSVTNKVPSEDAVYKALTDKGKKFVTDSLSADANNVGNLQSLSKAILVSKAVGEACCGKAMEVQTVESVYTQIGTYNKLVVLKVTNKTDITSATLAVSTGNSQSTVTQEIITSELLSAGEHYFLLSLSSAERYIRCMNGVSAATGVILQVCELVTNDLEVSSQEIFGELAKELVDEYQVSTIYTGISATAYPRIYEVTLANDLENLHLALSSGQSAANEKVLLIPDGSIKAGTYYFYVEGDIANSYIRCYGANTITVPTGVTIKRYKTLKNSAAEQVFPTPSQIGAVDENQSPSDYGKVLGIGVDGKVVPVYVTPQGIISISGLALRSSRILYLGEELLDSVSVEKTGFSGDMENGFSLAANTSGELLFDFDSVIDKKYAVILSVTNDENVFVTIGDEPEVDIYIGHSGEHIVGFLSMGGKLKISRPTFYNAPSITITNIQLREIVSQEDADITKIIITGDVNFSDNNYTDFWNVAIGPADALSKIQNGSRNIAIGKSSLQAFKSGTRNIAVGTFSLSGLEEGDYNVAIGADCNWQTRKSIGTIAIGMGSIGAMKTIDGVLTMGETVRCVSIGHYAMGGSGIKEDRTALITPTDCVAVGAYAGFCQNLGCIAIGADAGKYSYGNYNTYIGYHSVNIQSYTGGNENVAIGAYSQSNGHSNTIAIGVGCSAEKDNQVVIGRPTITETKLFGNLVVRGTDGIVRRVKFNNDNTVTWETVS